MKRIFALLLALLPLSALAEGYDDVVHAELRPGWRLPNGDHLAALHLTLAPGWKTYWRSPGDAGIPPDFEWRGVRGDRVTVSWPTPTVFWQSGMRSVGYDSQVVLPLRISDLPKGKSKRLSVVANIGICKDVCLPHRIKVSAKLPAKSRKPDPLIAAAMANLPYSAQEAGISHVRCQIRPTDRGMGLKVTMRLPKGTGDEETVIEARDPHLWVSDPKTRWSGGTLTAQATVSHSSGGSFALDRSGLRITILDGVVPVEINGCQG
ncbi:MAG: protein-disulfide reductase DsbD family protein [Pelagimonas sp.]|jgi:DsbC/DsbD-like thiol-disulfide interchange protein|nr:protein-disulfide reductase DsbD family protein [Pelagimonas sp.]